MKFIRLYVDKKFKVCLNYLLRSIQTCCIKEWSRDHSFFISKLRLIFMVYCKYLSWKLRCQINKNLVSAPRTYWHKSRWKASYEIPVSRGTWSYTWLLL